MTRYFQALPSRYVVLSTGNDTALQPSVSLGPGQRIPVDEDSPTHAAIVAQILAGDPRGLELIEEED